MRLLLTRPSNAGDSLEQMLRQRGHEVLHEPLFTVEFMPFEAVDISELGAAIATSSNALRALPAGSPLMALPLFAVGRSTARLARELGFDTVIVGEGGADALLPLVMTHAPPASGSILYLRGERVAFDLAGAFTRAGYSIRSRTVYRAVAANRFGAGTVSEFVNETVGGVMLLSPRTSETYLRLISEAGLTDRLGRPVHFCLSTRVAAPLRLVGVPQIAIAKQPDLQELVALVEANATHSRRSG